jgi:hypothetical protein
VKRPVRYSPARRSRSANLELSNQPPDIFQAKFDPEPLKTVEPDKRFRVIHDTCAKKPSNWLIVSRIFLRCTIMSIKPCSSRNSAVWNPFGKS